MKNVKVALADEVSRWVRACAAEEEKSVSRYLGDLLEQRMLADKGYEEARRRFLERPPTRMSDGRGYPRREKLHDRDVFVATTLDVSAPAREGAAADTDVRLAPEMQAALWQEWLERGPQGPIDEGDEPDSPEP